MKTKLVCDNCGFVFTQPFVKATQILSCIGCDFCLVWDGEETKSIVEKSISLVRNGIQLHFAADLIEEVLRVDIERCDWEAELEGTVIAEIPLKEICSEIKLDYAMCKEVLRLCEAEIPKKAKVDGNDNR